MTLKERKRIMNTTTGTTSFNNWSEPRRVEVNEYADKIEMIYKQTSLIIYCNHLPTTPPEERVFKIVFSCVNGVWNKSERIYGNIIPSQSESYKF